MDLTTNLNGPETQPLLGYVKDFPIVDMVLDLTKNDKIIRKELINYANSDHRKWMGKVTFWACNNGWSVETMKLEDYHKYYGVK